MFLLSEPHKPPPASELLGCQKVKSDSESIQIFTYFAGKRNSDAGFIRDLMNISYGLGPWTSLERSTTPSSFVNLGLAGVA